VRLIAVFLITMLLPAAAAAETWIIHPDGSGDFPTLQAAIDAIGQGEQDTLLLGDGVFEGPGNRELVIYVKNVFFESLSGSPGACIIDTALKEVVSPPSDIGDTWWRSIRFRNAGGFSSDRSWMDFEDCEFSGWDSRGTGSWESRMEFRSCSFWNCSAIGGGGWWVSNRYYSCSFEENHGRIAASGLVDCVLLNNDVAEGSLLGVWTGDTTPGFLSVERCLFMGNAAQQIVTISNGGIDPSLDLIDCVFVGNQGTVVWSVGNTASPYTSIVGCAFVGNCGEQDSDVLLDGPFEIGSTLNIERSIFAFRQEGSAFAFSPDGEHLQLIDCDIYGNSGGDWVGPIADQYGIGCNMSEHPLFCDWAAGDVSLYTGSPCLPENNACAVLIGAEGQGCDDPTAAPPSPAFGSPLAAHPNPFNPSVRLSFTLAASAPDVRLTIFDAAGRRAAVLVDGPLLAGEHTVDWDAGGYASGVYLARLVTPAGAREAKLILLR
jgi:hypothetical protein